MMSVTILSPCKYRKTSLIQLLSCEFLANGDNGNLQSNELFWNKKSRFDEIPF